MNYAKTRPERPERPDNADEILEERIDDTLDQDEDDEPITDGGYVVGFLRAVAPTNRQQPASLGVRNTTNRTQTPAS